MFSSCYADGRHMVTYALFPSRSAVDFCAKALLSGRTNSSVPSAVYQKSLRALLSIALPLLLK